MERGLLPTERLVVEEPQTVHRDVTAAPRELSLAHQVEEIGLDLAIRDAIRGAVAVGGESGDSSHVARLGLRSHATDSHVVNHAGSKLTHGGTSFCAVEGGA